MEQYISKAALVAEIDKKLAITSYANYGAQRIWAYNDVKEIINTLEVKEVDLEKEYDNLVADNGVLSIAVNYTAGLFIAEHFFELGLKAQKGEEV